MKPVRWMAVALASLLLGSPALGEELELKFGHVGKPGSLFEISVNAPSATWVIEMPSLAFRWACIRPRIWARKLSEIAIAKRAVVTGVHFPVLTLGTMERDGEGGYRYEIAEAP